MKYWVQVDTIALGWRTDVNEDVCHDNKTLQFLEVGKKKENKLVVLPSKQI